MKGMVAMETQVMRRLARAARAAGRDPATDPIPGLRRDVIFCSTADEEAGGWHGAHWLVENHPEWLHAAGALNEAGGISTTYGGVRFYPIQVAEKGFVVYKIHVKGRWGHGSVPTPDNAAVLAAQQIKAGDQQVVVAGGQENMSASPHVLAGSREGFRMGDAKLIDSMIVDGSRADRSHSPRSVRPGPGAHYLGDDPRHDLRRHRPGRSEIQRHPRRGRNRDRLPHPAGNGRAVNARRVAAPHRR